MRLRTTRKGVEQIGPFRRIILNIHHHVVTSVSAPTIWDAIYKLMSSARKEGEDQPGEGAVPPPAAEEGRFALNEGGQHQMTRSSGAVVSAKFARCQPPKKLLSIRPKGSGSFNVKIAVGGDNYTDKDWQMIRDFLQHPDSDWSCLFDNENEPILRIFRKAPPTDVVDLILENWPKIPNVPSMKECIDADSKTVLHHAIENGASFDTVVAIISMDKGLIEMKDARGKYPLASACTYASENVLDANSENIINFLIHNGKELAKTISLDMATIPFDEISNEVLVKMILKPHGTEINGRRCRRTGQYPLQIAIMKKSRSGDIVSLLAGEDERLRLRGMPRLMREHLAQKAATSFKLQKILNDETCRRLHVVLLMLGFTMHLGLVGTFSYAAETFVTNERSHTANIFVGIFGGYFLIREVFQLKFEGFAYFTDLRNWIALVRVALVLWSTAALFREPEQDRTFQNGDGEFLVYGSVRELFLVTGVFCVVGLIVFLRSTFLPFAEFVIGLITILTTLGPFLFVSFLVVFAFGFMYFMVETNEEECVLAMSNSTSHWEFCTLGESILTVFNFFFNGPQQTNEWSMDIIFGVAVVIILLNVVIAIVSDAWFKSKEKIGRVFWAYRVNFLTEMESFSFKKWEWHWFWMLGLHRILPNDESKHPHRTMYKLFMEKPRTDMFAYLEKSIVEFNQQLSSYEQSILKRDGSQKMIRREYSLLAFVIFKVHRRLDNRFEQLDKAQVLSQSTQEQKAADQVYADLGELYTTTNCMLERLKKVRIRKTYRFILFGADINDLSENVMKDTINWNEEPFATHVQSAEDYYNWVEGGISQPEGMSDEDYNMICQSGSWERNWYWACSNHTKGKLVKTKFLVIIQLLTFVFLMVLGFFTLGFYWPRSVRQYLFSVSTDFTASPVQQDNENENYHNSRRNKLEAATEARLAAVEEEFKNMSEKLDTILNLVAEQQRT